GVTTFAGRPKRRREGGTTFHFHIIFESSVVWSLPPPHGGRSARARPRVPGQLGAVSSQSSTRVDAAKIVRSWRRRRRQTCPSPIFRGGAILVRSGEPWPHGVLDVSRSPWRSRAQSRCRGPRRLPEPAGGEPSGAGWPPCRSARAGVGSRTRRTLGARPSASGREETAPARHAARGRPKRMGQAECPRRAVRALAAGQDVGPPRREGGPRAE